jgi:hypothetical protein
VECVLSPMVPFLNLEIYCFNQSSNLLAFKVTACKPVGSNYTAKTLSAECELTIYTYMHKQWLVFDS